MRPKRPPVIALSAHNGPVFVEKGVDGYGSNGQDSLSWFRNRFDGRRTCYVTGRIDSSDAGDAIILPHYYAVEYQKMLMKQRSTFNSRSRTPDHQPVNRPNRMDDLPSELLFQILRYLVPTGRIFHSSPISIERSDAISIHQICSVNNPEDAALTFLSIALTSRRFKDVVYHLFYGENQFILELAIISLTSYIGLTPDPTTPEEQVQEDSPGDDLELANASSWNRVRLSPPGPYNPMYPLFPSSMACVKNLTICISLSKHRVLRYEENQLFDYVSTIASCFEERQSHSLKRLDLRVAVAERRDDRNISTQLQFVRTRHSMRLQLDVHDVLNFAENRAIPVNGGEQLPPSVIKKRNVKIEKIVSPLGKIWGDVEIRVGGLLDATAAYKLRSSVQGSVSESQRPLDMHGEPARKRVRL